MNIISLYDLINDIKLPEWVLTDKLVIYKISRFDCDKCYIGKSRNLLLDLYEHISMSNSGDKSDLHNDILNLGLTEFYAEILEYLKSDIESYSNTKLFYYINKFESNKSGYNSINFNWGLNSEIIKYSPNILSHSDWSISMTRKHKSVVICSTELKLKYDNFIKLCDSVSNIGINKLTNSIYKEYNKYNLPRFEKSRIIKLLNEFINSGLDVSKITNLLDKSWLS